jgi:dolichyl-phosphate beta-glucosyltransferase
MAARPDLSLIVPAYNEARRIGDTLADLQSYLDGQRLAYEIIVCADGNDGTRELVAQRWRHDERIAVLGSVARRGKGHGVRQGVARARGRIIGFLDADDKVPIEELGKIIPWLEQGQDIVIGSRALADSRIEHAQPWYRRLGSRGFGLAMHLIVGMWNIRDTQCGFKFFRAEVARDLFTKQRIDGYMFDVEILYLATRAGYRIREVGVRWRDDGDSRLNLIAGNWRNLLDLFKIRLGRAARPAVSERDCAEPPAHKAA